MGFYNTTTLQILLLISVVTHNSLCNYYHLFSFFLFYQHCQWFAADNPSIKRICVCMCVCVYMYVQCESKKVAPLKLFAVFYLLLNLSNCKLSRLLHKHIPMSTPILVHLSTCKYLCEMYHFYRRDPSNFKNSIQFVTKFMNFS